MSTRRTLAVSLLCVVSLVGLRALAGPACSDPAKCLAECTDKIARSCSVLGSMYENGIGVAENRARAMKFYKQACDLGDKDACKKGKGLDAEAAGENAAQAQAAAKQSQDASKQAEEDYQAAERRHDDCLNVTCVNEFNACQNAVPDIDTCWGPGHPATSPEANACEAQIKSSNRACEAGFKRCNAGCEPEWREAKLKHGGK